MVIVRHAIIPAKLVILIPQIAIVVDMEDLQ
jgi:hypothetical protein